MQLVNELSSAVMGSGVQAMPIEVGILHADGTILAVNDAWRRFADENHGTHPDYWVGENYFDVLDRADIDAEATDVVEGLHALIDGTRDRYRLDYPCHSPEEHRWFMLDATTFTHDRQEYLFLTHYNITDRKLAELQAKARADQLETLLEVLTHDLRNPLNLIDGYVELLAAELDESEEIETIQEATTRITEITEATLTYAKSGSMSTVEPVSVARVAREVWQAEAPAAATLRVQGDTTIVVDRNLLEQFFENLFRNVLDHAGPDCTVTVEGLPDGFSIVEDGPRMPREVREKAMIGDFSTRGTDDVTLAIVQAVVAAHDGTLTISDADGGGVRFEIHNMEVAP
ncbi:MAG: ATP-binding protein [archaeon]